MGTPQVRWREMHQSGRFSIMPAKAIAYIDPEGRLDLDDLQRQIDWFRSQNMLKGDPKIADMIDKRVVIPLKGK